MLIAVNCKTGTVAILMKILRVVLEFHLACNVTYSIIKINYIIFHCQMLDMVFKTIAAY